MHDDTARVNWKLAVIESLNLDGDGKIHSANIQTANGSTNRPIACLYPLEVNSTEICTTTPATPEPHGESVRSTVPTSRPTPEAAKRGQQQMKEWINLLSAPLQGCPKDVNTDPICNIILYCGIVVLLTCMLVRYLD